MVAPGNAGLPLLAEGSPIRRHPLERLDAESIVELAGHLGVDLAVIGPEAPLVDGAVDALLRARVPAFGPTRAAARLEASKAFLKDFATRHGIPTAPYDVVRSFERAEEVIRARGAPIVVKADGLCAGKGVVVASTVDEALAAARALLVEERFGAAGDAVVLEDVIAGVEVSVHAVTDGERLLVLPPARDHKRVGDGDRGPNTGGMGAVAPSPGVSAELLARIEREILRPTLEGMRAEGRPFRGVLFAGIMVTPAGDPMLLEHNVRFGDPECEVLMALLDGDVAELLHSAAIGRLDERAVTVSSRHAVAVVLAAPGYPEAPKTGGVIEGLGRAEAIPGVVVHHAGTALREGAVVTAGGRVLAVTAAAASLDEARALAYRAAAELHFEGVHYRRDIGRVGGTGAPENPTSN